MGLETVDHISDLDESNPPGGDSPTQGDDHIRNIKKALSADFGGISSPVYEDADVNGAGGSVPVTGVTMSSWEARIKANEDAILGASGFIVGMIQLWSGTVGTIPAEWALCDGLNGTPDLQNKFIVAAGDTYAPADEGGSDTPTTSSDGSHTHPLTVAADSAGLEEHNHFMFVNATEPAGLTPVQGDNAVASNTGGGIDQSYVMIESSPDTNRTAGSTGNTGTAGPTHNHTGSTADADGDHTHTVDNRPQYFALAYIMYVGTP